RLEELRALTEEYRKLPERRKQKVHELHRTQHEIQLRRYLQQFDIASAEIPLIKEGRKAMLSAYGISDASDVTTSALEAVPAFGQPLITHRTPGGQSLGGSFPFTPGRGIDPADLERIDRDIAKRRSEIEALLSVGPSQLSAIGRRI